MARWPQRPWQSRRKPPLTTAAGSVPVPSPGEAGRQALTFFGNDRQGDGDAGILDQLHDAVVGQVDDGLPVHRGDEVSDLELPTAVGGASVYDSADFMGNDCEKNIPGFFNYLRNLSVLDLSSSFKDFTQHRRKAL